MLGEEIEHGGAVHEVFDRFMARRYARCKLVVEGCRQISEWEQAGEVDADFDGVIARVGMAVAQPL